MFLPLISFAIPILLLYILEPATFEVMWKGRTFQIFFIWLMGLELILDWDSLRESKLHRLNSLRTVLIATTIVLPTLYVVASYYWGLNEFITNWAIQNHVTQGLSSEIALWWEQSFPLSTEYLAFAAIFSIHVWLVYGIKGIKGYSVPAFFLFMVGAVYIIDSVFPYGQFAPFQIFVPTTTALAAAILNLMGYATNISYIQNSTQGTMSQLTAVQNSASATFSIAWPCAGIESFLIFTVVVMLFLKRMNMSWKGKTGYFVFGAAVTYFINAFRIVNIFTTGIVYGVSSSQVNEIHVYYGPLYAVSWIVIYPLLIMVTQSLWRKMINRKQPIAKTQPSSLTPV